MKKINIWAIAVFYIIAIICRYLTNKTDLLDIVGNIYLKSILTGVGPAIGALAVFYTFGMKPKMSLRGSYKNLWQPALLFWAFPILFISLIVYYQKGEFPWLVALSILIYGLFEEIGWRGFLHQALKPLPNIVNILIVASLWFVWHLNFEITSSNGLFFAILVFGSWGIGKVADSTHSLLAVSAFHSLNNFFPELDTTKAGILISLLVVWVVALVIRKKRQPKIAEAE